MGQRKNDAGSLQQAIWYLEDEIALSAVNAKGLADLTQGELKNLEDIAKSLGAKGLAFIKAEKGEWKSPIVKFFSDAEKAALTAKLGIEEGDVVFFAAAPWEKACAILVASGSKPRNCSPAAASSRSGTTTGNSFG